MWTETWREVQFFAWQCIVCKIMHKRKELFWCFLTFGGVFSTNRGRKKRRNVADDKFPHHALWLEVSSFQLKPSLPFEFDSYLCHNTCLTVCLNVSFSVSARTIRLDAWFKSRPTDFFGCVHLQQFCLLSFKPYSEYCEWAF